MTSYSLINQNSLSSQSFDSNEVLEYCSDNSNNCCILTATQNNVSVDCGNDKKIYKFFTDILHNPITEPFHINNSSDFFIVEQQKNTYRSSSSVNNSFSSSNFTFLARNFHRSIQK